MKMFSGFKVATLDGDSFRKVVSKDLGFSPEDSIVNINRAATAALTLTSEYHVVLCSFVSPNRRQRESIKQRHFEAGTRFVEVFVDTPLSECIRRDPKGLYDKALREDDNLLLDEALYEKPIKPDLSICTMELSVSECSELAYLAISERLKNEQP